jgi:hypothetical protein
MQAKSIPTSVVVKRYFLIRISFARTWPGGRVALKRFFSIDADFKNEPSPHRTVKKPGSTEKLTGLAAPAEAHKKGIGVSGEDEG